MDPVKLASLISSSRQVDRDDKAAPQRAPPPSSSTPEEAVKFDPRETEIGQLFEPTRDTVDAAIAKEVADLRDKIKSGDYRPNLREMAARILAALEALR